MGIGDGTAKPSGFLGGLNSFLGGPVGGLLGSVVGGIFGSRGQDKANETNIMLARENRAWQERMSNTAYQRAANDLNKAGLNRVLAFGSPSSTPAGNVAQVQNKADAAMRSAASAAQVKNLVAQNELLRQQARHVGYQADRIKPIAKAGDAAGGIMDTIEKDFNSGMPLIGSNGKRGHLTILPGGPLDNLRNWGSGAKDRIEADVKHQREKMRLQRQIEHDEKALKMYKNEDVDTRQIEKRLREARWQLKLLGDK